MQINDKLYHPWSMGILEFIVVSIREFKNFKQYVLHSVENVGACGTIEILVQENNEELRFVELLAVTDNGEYSNGLEDFIEGFYFKSKTKARLDLYKQQKVLAYTNWENSKRLCEEAKKRLDQVELLVKELSEELANKGDHNVTNNTY